jgi:hypothetical protein
MTDEQLDAIETLCRAEADAAGSVRVRAEDILELLAELRALRGHAADLSAHAGTIANLHRLVSKLCAYGERVPGPGVQLSGHIAVQDPGR